MTTTQSPQFRNEVSLNWKKTCVRPRSFAVASLTQPEFVKCESPALSEIEFDSMSDSSSIACGGRDAEGIFR
jgi:hypothetical protein